MQNKHPIVTGIILGVALSWGTMVLGTDTFAHLTGYYPVKTETLLYMIDATEFLGEKLKDCRIKKGA